MITDKINFRQPKYMLPLIIYLPLLGAGYFILDLFDTELAEVPTRMQTTEYLNPELPEAQLRNDGIGGRYESMVKSYGRIQDYSAVENIGREEEMDGKEGYDSKYSEEDIALLDAEAALRTQELERMLEMQERLRQSAERGERMAADTTMTRPLTEAERIALSKEREKEAVAALDKALAEARLQGKKGADDINRPVGEPVPKDTVMTGAAIRGEVEIDGKSISSLKDTDETQTVAKATRPSSSYFNTLTADGAEPRIIKAIIDEDIKAVEGSRVRLRLLDDVVVSDRVIPKGTYLYATMSGFGNQRVKGTVKSLLVEDELLKISLSLYDTDGMEGLYVPDSQFRETAKDVTGGAMSGTMNLNSGTGGNSFTQWGMQAIQNAYQRTNNALSKAVRRNRVQLKYGTFVYLVNDREKNVN